MLGRASRQLSFGDIQVSSHVNENHFILSNFKTHISVDEGSELIRKAEITPALDSGKRQADSDE